MWRQLVRKYIVDVQRRVVDDFQPALFGVGLYELRSPAARQALISNGPFEVQPDVFVRFVAHNNRENHRATQGFRTGWLMFLGVPLDYRNEYDISNAVVTFGTFHH